MEGGRVGYVRRTGRQWGPIGLYRPLWTGRAVQISIKNFELQALLASCLCYVQRSTRDERALTSIVRRPKRFRLVW